MGLLQKYGPERVRNTPISEQGIIGATLGAALVGMRPVAELMYIDFSAIAMDQIVNQVAKVRYMFGGKANTSLVIRTQAVRVAVPPLSMHKAWRHGSFTCQVSRWSCPPARAMPKAF